MGLQEMSTESCLLLSVETQAQENHSSPHLAENTGAHLRLGLVTGVMRILEKRIFPVSGVRL